MKYFLSALVITLAIFFSCNSGSNTELFSTDNLTTEQFTINTDKDTVLQTPGGALLNIPKGSLESPDGNSITLEIKEAYIITDIVKAGLTTASNGQPLSSGGMIYINPTAGQKVTIKKALRVAIPSNNLDNGMKLYKGEQMADGKINWINPTTLPENKQIAAIDQGETLFQQNCAGCHAIESKLIGPALAHFLKRFPLPEDRDENYWGYHPHPYVGMLARTSDKIKDSSWLTEGDIMSPSKPDTSKKGIVKRNHQLAWLRWYECHMHEFSSTGGPAYNFTTTELDNIYKYIQNESDRLNIPYEGGSTYENDRCFDSCQIYSQKINLLNKLKTIAEEKREKFIEENGGMVEKKPDLMGTWGTTDIGPGTKDWFVTPEKYKATYYQFTIESFGWYNIDILLTELGEKVKESELFLKLTGEWTNRVNVFLIIPSFNVYGEGGPATRNPREYAFFNKNGSIPLPQNEKAFILAVSEKDDKVGYALKEFRTGLKQELEVAVLQSSKEEFDKAIASFGSKQMSVGVKPSINADSIRAADKKIKDINKELKETDKLKPKNCNCDCLSDEGFSMITSTQK